MTSDNRVSKWYFGGMASAGAACCTHPLDLLKVHLQTAVSKAGMGSASGSGNIGLVGNTLVIIKSQGVLALYNGLTASLLRQLTFSTTRFGIYEVAKQKIATKGEQIPFYKKALLAGISGAAGGLIGLSHLLINLLTYYTLIVKLFY
jgi:dicarboxylate transporter 10